MDEFFKQKLIWTPVNSEYKFTIVNEPYFFNNSIFMITGDDLYYLCGILNSMLYCKYFEMTFTNNKYNYGSAKIFSNLPIIDLNEKAKKEISHIVKVIIKENKMDLCSQIDEIIEKNLALLH